MNKLIKGMNNDNVDFCIFFNGKSKMLSSLNFRHKLDGSEGYYILAEPEKQKEDDVACIQKYL